MRLTSAEAELVRLWRATDERGRMRIMEAARFEAEAAREARGIGWRVVDGEGRRDHDNRQ